MSSNRKKVLIVTALAGFLRRFLEHDVKILQEMGFEVHCAANRVQPLAGDIDAYMEQIGVVFHQVDFSSTNPICKDNLKAYFELKQLKKEYHFELVHCHTPIAGAIGRLVFFTERTSGTKIIYTTHGFYFHSRSSKKQWFIYHTIEDIMSYLTDMIITINYEDFGNAQKMHCKNVRHINGVGVDTNKFINCPTNREYRKKIGIEEDTLMILAIGELSRRKNHQIIIKALGQLKNKDVVFVICGNAMNGEATTDELKQLAKRNNVRLLLLGLRSDIPQICKCADIGAMPSLREGLGLSGIEMLASGLPLVASSSHGIKDYVEDGKNGFLADPYSADEFAEAIQKLSDKAVRTNMKEKCIESSRKFDISISFEQMEKIYRQLLNE